MHIYVCPKAKIKFMDMFTKTNKKMRELWKTKHSIAMQLLHYWCSTENILIV